jgi:cytochrome c oxidase subunit III
MPVVTEERKIGGIIPPPVWPGNGGGGGDGSGDPGSSFPVSKGQIGLWVLLTGVIMLFAGLSSAYIVLRGVPAWQNIALPSLLWPNTAVLVLSSITVHLARRSVIRNRIDRLKLWLGISAALGLTFLAGQIAAWRQLVHAGVFLPSTLQSSFFYVLTGIHGLHLLGGVLALTYVFVQAMQHRLTVFNWEPLKLCATYWHFMDALWLYLFLLLLLS